LLIKTMKKKRILIIEDEKKMQRLLKLLLEENDYIVKTADDGQQGIDVWKTFNPHVVLTDIIMPKLDGMQLLELKTRDNLAAPLIIMTAHGTIDMAVFAMKHGAFDYLTKPFDNSRVVDIINHAVSVSKVDHDGALPETDEELFPIIGSSPAIQQIYKEINQVCQSRVSVMITGESGTGKDLVAQAIHARSDHQGKELIRVNCAAIPNELLESELFGHKKGSFTGAVGDRTGSFIHAHGSTLLLDEIGDLPLDLQPKLLHAVEEKIITPIGSSRSQSIDVKILSATNRDIVSMVEEGLFRSDLYYRLNTFQIHLPPLRDRIEDIEELANYFLLISIDEHPKKTELTFTEKTIDILTKYHWPGNVRELRNIVERMVICSESDRLTPNDLPESISCFKRTQENGIKDLADLQTKEKQLIISALKETGGNQVKAATLLNISRNTLRYRMKKYGMLPNL